MIDAYSDNWREVAAKLNEWVEQSRSRLEQNELGYGEAQYLRGRISLCRDLLEMAKPKVVRTTPPVELRPKDRSGI